ncbi:hypothetical protein COOONC_06814 [Cooperia oncophora]
MSTALQDLDDDNQLFEECTANVEQFSTCLALIKPARELLQSKADLLGDFCSSIKSKTEQKEFIAEVEELEKETRYLKLLEEAESFICNIETHLSDTKVELQKVQRKLRVSSQGRNTYQSTQYDQGYLSGIPTATVIRPLGRSRPRERYRVRYDPTHAPPLQKAEQPRTVRSRPSMLMENIVTKHPGNCRKPTNNEGTSFETAAWQGKVNFAMAQEVDATHNTKGPAYLRGKFLIKSIFLTQTAKMAAGASEHSCTAHRNPGQ